MCDESFALNATVNLPDNVDRGWFYLHVTWLNFVYWVLGVAMGSIGSQFITLNLKGIEFVLAALFAVIFLDILLKGKNLLPGCIGLGVSFLMRIVLGPDVFMLPAMALMVVIFSLLYKFKGKKETDLADEGGRLHDSLGNDDYHWRRRPWYDGYAFYFVCRFCQVGKTAGHRDVLRRYVAGRRYGALGGVFVKGCIALGSAERHSGGHCFGNIGGRHYWRRNLLLSIAVGTIVYMFLVQEIF